MVKPRISATIKGQDRIGDEAVELSAEAGLELDEWQAHVLRQSLLFRSNDKFAAREVGVQVARQNGKGGILEARELAGLFILEENFIVHSAHQFDTSLEAFRRLLFLVEETPRLAKQVKRIARSHGEEGIELTGNRRIRFRTRTKGGGRGFSGDCVILDEAMFLAEMAFGALLPTLSAKPNPQVWYTGSAVDQLIHEHGVVFARVRERGMAGEDPSLAYFDWSVEGASPDEVPEDVASDGAAWAQANPALGIRIDREFVELERRAMDRRTFAVERLGVGDWPRTDHVSTAIDFETWLALEDANSVLLNPVSLAYDVSPDRTTSISAAGRNQEGRWHVEVIENRRGTSWAPERIAELAKTHRAVKVTCDGFGPAGSLVPAIEALGVEVETVTAPEHAAACGRLVDVIEERTLRHLGSAELTGAVRSAGTRPLGDAWAWSRKNSTVNISPLVSATLALSAAMLAPVESEDPVIAWG